MSADSNEIIPHGWHWNEAEFGESHETRSVLVSLIAFAPDKTPVLIGTAFIVQANEQTAIAITAAHNLTEGVLRAQNPGTARHPTALAEFLPEQKLSLDRLAIRAIHVSNGRVEACAITEARWHRKLDIAFLQLAWQDQSNPSFFREIHLTDRQPQVGDRIGLLGYGEMKRHAFTREGPHEPFRMQQRIVLRCGTVQEVCMEGHVFCRGPCVCTTIPVYGGMSGGPAFFLDEVGLPAGVFGVICSDDPENETNLDRSKPGAAIVPILPMTLDRIDGSNHIRFDVSEFEAVSLTDGALAR